MPRYGQLVMGPAGSGKVYFSAINTEVYSQMMKLVFRKKRKLRLLDLEVIGPSR